MLLVTYDIQNDKLRTQFSKFLKQYGWRVQYSVFELKSSERILNLVLAEIEGKFLKKFSQADSVLIFPISQADEKKTIQYGYAANKDDAVIFV